MRDGSCAEREAVAGGRLAGSEDLEGQPKHALTEIHAAAPLEGHDASLLSPSLRVASHIVRH